MTRLHLNRFHLIPTILFLPHIHGIIQASFFNDFESKSTAIIRAILRRL